MRETASRKTKGQVGKYNCFAEEKDGRWVDSEEMKGSFVVTRQERFALKYHTAS